MSSGGAPSGTVLWIPETQEQSLYEGGRLLHAVFPLFFALILSFAHLSFFGFVCSLVFFLSFLSFFFP